jgi:hypothetical protein
MGIFPKLVPKNGSFIYFQQNCIFGVFFTVIFSILNMSPGAVHFI